MQIEYALAAVSAGGPSVGLKGIANFLKFYFIHHTFYFINIFSLDYLTLFAFDFITFSSCKWFSNCCREKTKIHFV